MYKTRLSYEWHNVLAYVDAQYYSRRSFDYVGDYKIAPYWMSDLEGSKNPYPSFCVMRNINEL
ncbi:hypothetical protein AAJCM20276_09580 [Acetobacter aceti]|uniref:Uncharacterized protein n=1 Tax=Acetobacter aceti TaxID=435 RepID=A0A6S6PMA4_ACEAC|nr:hypothetical protein AAJCM20276_09580 [Acetobacter aceti]